MGIRHHKPESSEESKSFVEENWLGRCSPGEVFKDARVVDMSCGEDFCAAVDEDGNVYLAFEF